MPDLILKSLIKQSRRIDEKIINVDNCESPPWRTINRYITQYSFQFSFETAAAAGQVSGYPTVLPFKPVLHQM